jgi:hypothetical protein
MCVYKPNKKIFAAGDHILNDISPTIQLMSDEWISQKRIWCPVSVWVTKAKSTFDNDVALIGYPLDADSFPNFFPRFRKKYKLASFLGVKTTLFGFLVREEEPKRPAKPRAVWID